MIEGFPEKYIFCALTAAITAGRAIMEVYSGDIEIEYKDDKSPLTIADKRSHEIIAAGLSAEPFRDTPFLSEEGKDIPFEEREKWEYFWIVDPLDGTKEFIKRNGEFTVNIALIYGERPVLGVIYLPAKEIVYFAADGMGAYRAMSGDIRAGDSLDALVKRSTVLPVDRRKSSFTLVGSRSHATKELEKFVREMGEKHGGIEFVPAGSSLKFCLVAEGKADVYPRFGPTMEWDTAAGQAIVHEAGGRVIDMETDEPLKYNKEKLLNPGFIAERE